MVQLFGDDRNFRTATDYSITRVWQSKKKHPETTYMLCRQYILFPVKCKIVNTFSYYNHFTFFIHRIFIFHIYFVPGDENFQQQVILHTGKQFSESRKRHFLFNFMFFHFTPSCFQHKYLYKNVADFHIR